MCWLCLRIRPSHRLSACKLSTFDFVNMPCFSVAAILREPTAVLSNVMPRVGNVFAVNPWVDDSVTVVWPASTASPVATAVAVTREEPPRPSATRLPRSASASRMSLGHNVTPVRREPSTSPPRIHKDVPIVSASGRLNSAVPACIPSHL